MKSSASAISDPRSNFGAKDGTGAIAGRFTARPSDLANSAESPEYEPVTEPGISMTRWASETAATASLSAEPRGRLKLMVTAGNCSWWASESAADVIVQHAKKWRASLIVMGTHGRSGLSRLALGSDAEKVVRTSPIPVLVVRAKAKK